MLEETILSDGKLKKFDITSQNKEILVKVDEDTKIEWDPRGKICMKIELVNFLQCKFDVE